MHIDISRIDPGLVPDDFTILVTFLIAGGTGFGAVAAVLGGVYGLTDARHRLRLDRLTAPKAK
ncbi:MAG: hypothetical protein J2P48_13465 [Alphaproteobacteria bacterium]|nr:hypothetical protein [Alphaproteobacteria bacterium]